MGIFGRKRVKKIENYEDRFVQPPDVRKIQPPVQPQYQPPTQLPTAEDIQEASPVSALPTYPAVSTVPPDISTASGTRGEEASTFAPLFIKLTKYRQILNNMNYLKMSLNLIRNQIAILNELEKLKAENMKLLQSTTEKVGQRLIKLDSEFMRPSGFMEDMPEMHIQEMESLENTITDLRAQIEGLKEEVESLA